MITLERIMRVTGRRQTNCTCPVCRSYCQTPCLGTPDDIMRLLEAGYAAKLTLTYWAEGMLIDVMETPIAMVQLIMRPEGCILFRDGLCELHTRGLKPTEGRLAHHILTEENLSFRKSLSWNVARERIRKENEPLIQKIFEQLAEFRYRSRK